MIKANDNMLCSCMEQNNDNTYVWNEFFQVWDENICFLSAEVSSSLILY